MIGLFSQVDNILLEQDVKNWVDNVLCNKMSVSLSQVDKVSRSMMFSSLNQVAVEISLQRMERLSAQITPTATQLT